MGAGGFSQRPVQRNVHGIYEQIKTKESQGQELFPGEKAWARGYEKKYLGIKESVKVTKYLTSSDRMRFRAVAKDKAIHSRSSDDFADVTEADIQAKIQKQQENFSQTWTPQTLQHRMLISSFPKRLNRQAKH